MKGLREEGACNTLSYIIRDILLMSIVHVNCLMTKNIQDREIFGCQHTILMRSFIGQLSTLISLSKLLPWFYRAYFSLVKNHNRQKGFQHNFEASKQTTFYLPQILQPGSTIWLLHMWYNTIKGTDKN